MPFTTNYIQINAINLIRKSNNEFEENNSYIFYLNNTSKVISGNLNIEITCVFYQKFQPKGNN